jgi:hypothetical protein
VKIPHRLKKVHFVSAAEKMTSFSGLKLTTDLAVRLGITAGLKRLAVKKRRRGIPIEDFVMSVVDHFLVGGDSLSDLAVLRSETATRAAIYGLEVPAPTTAGETLRKFSVGNIRQMESVIRHATLEAEGRICGDGAPITLDLDSSIFEVHGYLKEGARYGYTGEKGLHPLLCFWAERRLLVGARLRAGNRASNDGAESFISECLGRLPAGRRVRMRLDAGFYSRFIVQRCLDRGVEFSISAPQTKPLVKRILAVKEAQWKKYPWEDGAEYTEFKYQPSNWPKAFRLVVKRTAFFEKDQRVIGQYFYTAMITNRVGAGASLLKFHLGRGGAENFIEEFKNGVGARLMPSQKFVANWAWLVIAQLAYNLAQWFKLLVLPAAEQSRQLKSLRLHWFCVAARVIRTGRRFVLALARGPDEVAAFARANELILAL